MLFYRNFYMLRSCLNSRGRPFIIIGFASITTVLSVEQSICVTSTAVCIIPTCPSTLARFVPMVTYRRFGIIMFLRADRMLRTQSLKRKRSCSELEQKP